MKPLPALVGLVLCVLTATGRSQEPPASDHPAGRTDPGHAGASVPEWRPISGGLELALRPAAGALVLLVRADPATTSLRVVRAAPDHPLTAAALAQRDGALAAINGSYFDSAGKPIGWIVSGGKLLAAPAPKGWGAFIVSGDRARIVAMKDAQGPADEALQAGPRLVIAGQANPSLKPQVARRAFVGLDARGRVVLGSTGPTQVSAPELAAFLARPESEGGAGLVDVLNLDGGSSAQLFAREASGEPIDLAGIPVPVLLEILPKPAATKARGTKAGAK